MFNAHHSKVPQHGLLYYLLAEHDFTLGLLHSPQLSNEVPVSGLRRDLIRREYPQLIQGRGPVLLRGHHTPDHLVLLQLQSNRISVEQGLSTLIGTKTAGLVPFIQACMYAWQWWFEGASIF